MLTIRRLDIVDARCLLRGAELRSVEIGVPMCTAVADESGSLIAFERLDGGKVSSTSIAIDKAFTAAASRNHTTFYGDEANPNSPSWRIKGTNGGHFSSIGGGVPITIDDVVVGGIGVSSGSAAQDVDVAEAAIDYFLIQSEFKASP